MKTDWSNYTIAYDGINYRVNYRDNGDLVACENYVANSPTPKNPQPLISNLPAGTYKTQDWKGDWWEFTLTEDLCGIGDVRDSVEFDRYSHIGFIKPVIKKTLIKSLTWQVYSDMAGLGRFESNTLTDKYFTGTYTKNILCSHLLVVRYYEENGYPAWSISERNNLNNLRILVPAGTTLSQMLEIVGDAELYYVLATPTRTPLTFTKNNDSTAPECPMEFLTDTPSIDYPAEVFDAGGMVKARGKNLFNSNANYSSISPNVTINFDGSIDVEIDNTSGINVRYAEFHPYNTALLLQPNNVYTISIISIDFPDNTSPVGKVEVGSYGSTVCAIPSQDRFITPHVPKTFVAQNYDVEETSVNTIRIVFAVAAGYKLHIKYYIQVQLGDTATSYEPYRPEVTAAIPVLRSVNDVADEFDVLTGKAVRRVSGVYELGGDKGWSNGSRMVKDHQRVYLQDMNDFPTFAGDVAAVYDYQSYRLPYMSSQTPVYGYWKYTNNVLYIMLPDTVSGWGNPYSPTRAEIKAYFNGWQMCHSDGASPYYKSEVQYNPETWEEWTGGYGTIVTDVSGITLGNGSASAAKYYNASFKTSTKYGFLYNVVSLQNTNRIILAGGGVNYPFGNLNPVCTVGNNKYIAETQSSFVTNQLILGVSGNGIVKVKDIRVFELPTGSQIESDFNNLTADQLAEKYRFYGNNPKCWKRITDGTGITSTLPTASYEGFTLYKMIYELAEPIEEQYTPVILPTYYPTTVITTTNDTPAELTTTATVKVEET
jgi:hypothetical protein